MCLKHWKMVPKALQDAVWATYRPGQCGDKRPSREWLTAARAAINAVWEKELPALARQYGERTRRRAEARLLEGAIMGWNTLWQRGICVEIYGGWTGFRCSN